MLENRHYSITDHFCLSIDQALRAIMDNPKTTGRSYPGKTAVNSHLIESQRKHSAGLMRINHTGEVCAQALYHGQALATRNPIVRQSMQQAAMEEGDHLLWCHMRLLELSSRTSYLNSFWYTGSFILGFLAGRMGDQWSLGFLAETEKQVVDHLEKHLTHLSSYDTNSTAILKQMQIDETQHRKAAIDAGAKTLPVFIKKSMQFASKIMVKLTYWI